MDVHAGPAELPEWHEFLASFQVRFRRPEGLQALERYTMGLLTEVPNKHCDTLAKAVPGTSLLAYSFLVWLERRQRRRAKRPDPPGDLVPPSVQAPAPDPAGNAS
jgi:hypothetical protein